MLINIIHFVEINSFNLAWRIKQGHVEVEMEIGRNNLYMDDKISLNELLTWILYKTFS